MRIYQYGVIEEKSLEELENKIIDLLKGGWQPIGGIAVHHENVDDNNIQGKVVFYQAIVKYCSE